MRASAGHRRHRCPIKEELLPAIAKMCGHILHYLRGSGFGGASDSRLVVTEAECAARQQASYDRHNVGRRSVFTKTDVAPK